MNDAMDQESATSPASDTSGKNLRGGPPSLPDASIYPFSPVGTKSALAAPLAPEPKTSARTSVRSAMFEALVAGDDDLAGMVAYAIYKQNKRDLLAAFEKMHERMPDENEIRAYMMGEETPRRVATYRHLAENFLASRDAAHAGAPGGSLAEAAAPIQPKAAGAATLSQVLARRIVGRRQGRGPSWLMAAYIAFLILLLVGMAYLIRNGFMPTGSGK